MFNLMEGEVGDGSVISAETIEVKESKKGTEYHRLKKVRVVSRGEAPVPKDSDKFQEIVLAKLDEILELLAKEPEPKLEEEEVVTDIGDEPIDLSEIPF